MGGLEYLTWLGEDGAQRHTLLVAASTYRLFAGMAASGEEGMEELTATPKVVLSRRLRESLEWANTTLVGGDAVEAARSMKDDGDVALRTIGSPNLCRLLLEAGILDSATGADRICDGWPDVALEDVETRTFDGKLQLFDFAPAVLGGPPTVPEPPAAELVS
jgi:hypothetical protein